MYTDLPFSTNPSFHISEECQVGHLHLRPATLILVIILKAYDIYILELFA
jgi:hypothetical protein